MKNLHLIRLELARDPTHPDGNRHHGYEFVAPLDPMGKLDLDAWHEQRELCHVHRFHAREEDMRGHLVHRPGGAGGATWVFHYDVEGDPDEDESGFHFETHSFRQGDYVSVKEMDEELHTFLVVSVRPLDV
ncbi:MAG: hypothetical protein Kilf2KO_44820 [Rhodospirillales bacterium]